MLTHSFTCSQPAGAGGGGAATGGAEGFVALDITSLSLTPSEETLLCSTASSQLASFPLANIDILKPSDNHFHFFGACALRPSLSPSPSPSPSLSPSPSPSPSLSLALTPTGGPRPAPRRAGGGGAACGAS